MENSGYTYDTDHKGTIYLYYVLNILSSLIGLIAVITVIISMVNSSDSIAESMDDIAKTSNAINAPMLIAFIALIVYSIHSLYQSSQAIFYKPEVLMKSANVNFIVICVAYVISYFIAFCCCNGSDNIAGVLLSTMFSQIRLPRFIIALFTLGLSLVSLCLVTSSYSSDAGRSLLITQGVASALIRLLAFIGSIKLEYSGWIIAYLFFASVTSIALVVALVYSFKVSLNDSTYSTEESRTSTDNKAEQSEETKDSTPSIPNTESQDNTDFSQKQKQDIMNAYKDLLNRGVITQQEYEQKIKELN